VPYNILDVGCRVLFLFYCMQIKYVTDIDGKSACILL